MGEAAEDRGVAVVGGGFSGAVMALKLARADPGVRIRLIERERRVGVGLAYGACGPQHLLNVPVSRMEVGLEPRFVDWLQARPGELARIQVPPGEALADAFAPRALFGRYVEEQVAAAAPPGGDGRLEIVRGEAVRLCEAPFRGVVLADGREVRAARVVLATGNLAPRPPALRDGWLYDGPLFTPDPWARDAFEGLDPDAPVLMIGAGLTMVDIALALEDRGHRGPMHAVSRHGWLPERHRSGGAWPRFLQDPAPATPEQALRRLRAEFSNADAQGVPWQRVMDSARPDLARVWRAWDAAGRRRFLAHLRTRWDVRRHRMGPQIADRLDALLQSARLQVHAGRLAACEARGQRVVVHVRGRGADADADARALTVGRVINCTGPRSDFGRLETPLYADLRRRGLIRPDSLDLGIETEGAAVVDDTGLASPWLYALGPLTRPALWEVTAVPEINRQIDLLVERLTDPEDAPVPRRTGAQADAFADLGAGI